MNRRQFLKLGAASSAALTAVSVTATLSGCSETLPENGNWKALRASDRVFIGAIAPVMLKKSLPEDKAQQTKIISELMVVIDTAIFSLGPYNAKQLRDLFNLLNFGLSRGLTTGVWTSWDKASFEEIENFLNKWRESSLGLLNLGYNGLNKLICATWYGNEASWNQIGYPGPPHADILITKSNQA